MKFNLTHPCGNCPFRTDIQFFLSTDRRKEIADDLRADKTFACHKTVNYQRWEEERDMADEGDTSYRYDGNESHCAGALIALHKNGESADNFVLRFAVMLGWYDPERLDLSAPVVESLDVFMSIEG